MNIRALCNFQQKNYFLVVSFLVVSVLTVSTTFVESTTFVVSFTVVLSEPSAFFDEPQLDAIVPTMATTRAKPKMCFFISEFLNVCFTIVLDYSYNQLLKVLFALCFNIFK